MPFCNDIEHCILFVCVKITCDPLESVIVFRGKVRNTFVVIPVFNSVMYCCRSTDVSARGSSWRVQTSVSRVSQCGCSTETGHPADLDTAQRADFVIACLSSHLCVLDINQTDLEFHAAQVKRPP